MNVIPHMISPSTPKIGTASTVPEERAPAKHLQTHRLPLNPEVPSRPIAKPTPHHRNVKRITLRFASQPPHSDGNPGVLLPSARKSLTLNPEIKVHIV
jgi:hypothetical protein